MNIFKDEKVRPITEKNAYFICLVIVGVAFNVVGSFFVSLLGVPLYLDTIGTVIAAYFGGYIPGIIVALIGSGLNSIANPIYLSYGVLNVLVAVITVFLKKLGWYRKVRYIIPVILIYACTVGVLGAVLTWLLYGFEAGTATSAVVAAFYNTGVFGRFFSQLLGDFLVDLIDKTINVVVVVIADRFLSADIKDKVNYDAWAQAPLSDEAVKELQKGHSRGVSLRDKLILILSLASTLTALAAVLISYFLFHNTIIHQHSDYAEELANMVAAAVDGDMIEEYLEKGEDAQGYNKTKQALERIRDASPYIEYLYVYKFEEDGCHVVFDLDNPAELGNEAGMVVPIDPAFAEYEQDFIEGNEISPTDSHDEYGWLLTAYVPIRNSDRKVMAYAAVDLSMEHVSTYGKEFLVSQISLFLGIFIFIFAAGLYFTEYKIILPLNSMAYTTSEYAQENEEAMEMTVSTLKKLDIRTGDEIENLYRAIYNMAASNLEYVGDINNKNATINEMQMSLINILADMVESRDQNTGDHIMKTAEYAKVIMEEMRREGMYEDQLTDEFISDVYHSTPLHDIGKISISDTILNKPGKLTVDEFDLMKEHSAIGAKIIDKVIESVPGGSESYLKEARNLALYHHEKWNGSGYPMGLSGEDIPLSARIMAVADVFDALVSERSYKRAFPIDEALRIIRDNVGTHFDPSVAGAFLNSLDEVERIAAMKDGEPKE
ncbi:HD domain-containing phosphohydrolase [Butyrivibrio sp. FCS014]|uniref:HD domain-containing phosphohydrolase n=1 Tax=Butyrivibrio sp. FCS014 TaxID=1408304 RepID=UPI000464CE97|nr:HD domain-containing phosphohydrolase [Butyrivibrio sp. FCS014]